MLVRAVLGKGEITHSIARSSSTYEKHHIATNPPIRFTDRLYFSYSPFWLCDPKELICAASSHYGRSNIRGFAVYSMPYDNNKIVCPEWIWNERMSREANYHLNFTFLCIENIFAVAVVISYLIPYRVRVLRKFKSLGLKSPIILIDT